LYWNVVFSTFYICIEKTTFPSIQGFNNNVTNFCHHQFLHQHISFFFYMYFEEGFLKLRWRWESFQSLRKPYPPTWKKILYIYIKQQWEPIHKKYKVNKRWQWKPIHKKIQGKLKAQEHKSSKNITIRKHY
jgi:hypothetical protein